MTFMLPRLVGRRRAQELLLLGRRVTAEDAHNWGMITTVVDDQQLDSAAAQIANELANGPTCAFGATKKLLNGLDDLKAHLNEEARSMVELVTSQDAREGVRAFLQRRAPRFAGR